MKTHSGSTSAPVMVTVTARQSQDVLLSPRGESSMKLVQSVKQGRYLMNLVLRDRRK
jgi:hypothetical protein